MNANMTGLRWLKSLHPCALDESRLRTITMFLLQLCLNFFQQMLGVKSHNICVCYRNE